MPRGVYPRKSKPKGQPRPKRDEARNGNPPAFSPTIEDLEALESVPSKARHGGNGRRPWGQPYETDASDFVKNSPWEELYDDAMLRLEKTPASKAIVYPFETEHEASRAHDSIAKRAKKRLGKSCILAGVRRDPPRLYVSRGPNWKA